jgi:hypothetical protein
MYWLAKTDCGALYDQDIGCSKAGGSWDVTVGFIAGAVFVAVCLAIILVSHNKKGKKLN